MSETVRSFIAAAAGASIASLFFIGWGGGHHHKNPEERGHDTSPPPLESRRVPPIAPVQGVPSSTQAASSWTVSEVAERVVVSVVNISTEKKVKVRSPFHSFQDPFFEQFFGRGFGDRQPKERKEKSLGSGVVVRQDGIILTNNHVIDGAETITVTFSDGRALEAEVVGTDASTDVGVLKLKEVPDELATLSLGDSDRMRLGETVLAVGNPFGVGQTVTLGIVSATGRSDVGIVDLENFIQTDAAINPGNSGGALVNTQGELIGINTAIMSRSGGYQGIGFAIPSNMVEQVMNSLLEHGEVRYGYLGVSIQDVDEAMVEALDLRTDAGALVADVSQGSPADVAGIRRGDVIIGIDGKDIDGTRSLKRAVAMSGAGTSVQVEVMRGAKTEIFKVKLVQLSDLRGPASTHAKTNTQYAIEEGPLSGLTVAPLNDEVRQAFGLSAELKSGVVIVSVEKDSDSARKQLREGDVIVELSRKPVSDLKTFKKVYKSLKKSVALLVKRGGSTMYLAFRG